LSSSEKVNGFSTKARRTRISFSLAVCLDF